MQTFENLLQNYYCFLILGHWMQKMNNYFDWMLIRSIMVLITKKLIFEYFTVLFKNKKIRIMKSGKIQINLTV